MSYTFKMPIGDWSDDGHGRCEYFTIQSNKPINEVRDIHFKSKEILDIEKICNEYEDSIIDDDTEEELMKLGFDVDEMYNKYGTFKFPSPEVMANIWIFLLQKADSELELTIVDDVIPTITFYGFDEKGRHIRKVGYGIYD